MPNSFPLDEALAAAETSREETREGLEALGGPLQGLRVGETAQQVDSYLGQLQQYLEVACKTCFSRRIVCHAVFDIHSFTDSFSAGSWLHYYES